MPSVEDVLPLSPLQEGLLFHASYDEQGLDTYVVQSILEIEGEVDAFAVQAAGRTLLRRYPNLRAGFEQEELRQPVQVVLKDLEVPFECVDLSDLDGEKRASEALAIVERDRTARFNLNRPPLLRFTLLRLAPRRCQLLLTIHHILVDGWSTSLLLRELLSLYASSGRDDGLPAPIAYRNYLVWLAQQDRSAANAAWQATLAGLDEPTRLSTSHTLEQVEAVPEETSLELSRTLTEALERCARQHGITLNTIVQGAWALLLGRLTGRDDVVFGVTVSGRPAELPGVERMIGLFINTVPVRVRLGSSDPLLAVLRRLQDVQAELMPHQHVSLAEIQRHAGLGALFDTLFVFENYPFDRSVLEQEVAGLRIVGASSKDAAHYPLVLIAAPGARLHLRVTYRRDCFEADTVLRWVRQLERVLGAIAEDPLQALGRVELLAPEERQQLLVDWNGSARFAPEATLPQLFEAQVEKSPDAFAIAFEGTQLSYAELNARANQLAHHLIARGAGPEARIALCLPRSVQLVIAVLGVLKSGAAYVPLDPNYPPERIALTLADSQPTSIVSDGTLGDLLDRNDNVILLDSWEIQAALAACPSTNPADWERSQPLVPEHAAYVIYTSGSTGKPKGVVVCQHNVVRLLRATEPRFHFGSGDVWTLFHSFSFDFSVWEILGALLYGGRLVVVPHWVSRSPSEFLELLVRERVTVLNQTPSAFYQLMQAEAAQPSELSLRWVIFGGEALDFARLVPWYERHPTNGPELVNMYGITETTVHVSFLAIDPAAPARPSGSSIGRGLSDLSTYVLDSALRPVPVEVPGELYVAGAGLARGYLGRPGLTSERFVASPFGQPGARMYRTGDRARWTPEGVLEFLGRSDAQLKIRGFRIEPGEVEAALRSVPDVADARVVAREDATGEKRLVGYVVANADAVLDVSEVRRRLRATLPEQLVPAMIVLVPSIPLTRNGKLDEKALPAPEWELDNTVSPRTPTEEILAAAFADVLAVPRVGIYDSFFDLGGHSLLATRLVNQVRVALGVELPVRALFERLSVARLAEEVLALQRFGAGIEVPPLLARPRPGALPLSFAQERLWFLDQLQPLGSAYNIPMIFRLDGRLDVRAFQSALDALVLRHESLRTHFEARDGRGYQVVSDAFDVPLIWEDLSELAMGAREEAIRERAIEEAGRPFDLSQPPLLRARLMRSSNESHVLLLTLHHIISDGWSMGVMVRELSVLYTSGIGGRAPSLPPLPVQYPDFALWQRGWLEGVTLERQLDYWREKLEGAPPALTLPTDWPRPALQSFRAGLHPLTVSLPLSKQVLELARAEGVTPFMLLLAAYQLVLGRWSGQDDVVVGAPIAGRTLVELEGLIGFFVNTLALRTRLEPKLSFRGLLRHVRETTLGAYAHQDMPFEKLVQTLQPVRDMSRQPIFQALFVMQNTPTPAASLPGLRITALEPEFSTAKFDLMLNLRETDDGLRGQLEYAADLFSPDSMARFAAHFAMTLEVVTSDPDIPLQKVVLTTSEERQRVVFGWNDTARELPPATLAEVFEARVATSPAATALVFQQTELTYGELNASANQLARQLVTLGVGPEHRVALCLPRSVEMVAGVLAIAKAGGAYLPLDPNHPPERLCSTVADAEPTLIVTTGSLAREFAGSGVPTISLDSSQIRSSVERFAATNLTDADRSRPLSVQHPAYVIYTSGSTGKPKGVVVTHAGISSLVQAYVEKAALNTASRVLQFAPLSFDAAFCDLMTTFASGAALVLMDQPSDAQSWASYHLTHVLLPSAVLAKIGVREELPMTSLVVGGDACPAELVNRWAPGRRMVNAYGPTETTVCASLSAPLSRTDKGRPPIGGPIYNTRTYVLDASLEPVSIGLGGELYIAGAGLARGYLGRAALTAERFVACPFGPPGARMYRSGDLARWRPDGALDFLGRSDDQVKLRGIRIEPGEVEASLLALAGVAEASVMVREDVPGEPRLLGYVVPVSGATLEASVLRQALASRLPEHLVPSAIVVLEAMPLTPHGKLDRNALPAPEWRTGAYTAPRTRVEEVVAGLFAEVLGFPQVGIHDSFFDLGGHSLLATRIVAQVRSVLGVELPVQALFRHPSVAALAEAVVALQAEGAEPARPPLQARSRGSK